MRSFIIHLTILALLGPCLFGCKYHSSNLLLRQADSLLDMKPDSALAILKNIPLSENLSDADQAYYALLTAAATDKSELPLLPCDSLLNLAIDYYDDNDKEMAVALLYKGRLMAQMGDREAAIKNNLEALDVLRNYPEETACRRLIYSSLGLWYGDCGLYDKALEVLNRSLLYSFNARDTAIAYNNIGYTYTMKELKDSSITYQRKAVEHAMLSKDTSEMITSWHSLSLYYRQFENLDSAVVYAHRVLQHAPNDHKVLKSYLYNMGDLYIDLERYDSAKYYLEKSLLLSKSQPMPYWSLALMEAELGDFRSAYHYLDTFVIVQDSFYAAERVTGVQHLVYEHQTASKVKDEQVKFERRMGWIILMCIVICFVLIVIHQRQINRKDRRQALYRQSLQYTTEKLNIMQQRIEENESTLILLRDKEHKNIALIGQKEQLIAQLKQEKLALRTWLFRQTPIYKKVTSLSEQQEVDKKARKVMTVLERQKLKNTLFEIYVDYVSSLQAQYPRLTEDDLLYLCLQEADIPSVVIALCFGYTDTATLNQRKSRLKSKMS